MTFLTNEQQKLIQEYYEMVHERLVEAIAQFHFQMQQTELQKIVEQALAKPSPPYKLTPRGCGLVEDRLCDNMNQ